MVERISQKVATLLVVLCDVEPTIWRRIEVRANVTFARLHDVLQGAMGWTDSHLHEFEVGEGVRVGQPGDDEWEEEPPQDENLVRLSAYARSGQVITYSYDFGDDWRHYALVERIAPAAAGVIYPRCVDGGRACPPEDCGGPFGYADLLEALRNPGHEEHASSREWVGRSFDPERFDAVSATKRMRAKVRHRPAERRGRRGSGLETAL